MEHGGEKLIRSAGGPSTKTDRDEGNKKRSKEIYRTENVFLSLPLLEGEEAGNLHHEGKGKKRSRS